MPQPTTQRKKSIKERIDNTIIAAGRILNARDEEQKRIAEANAEAANKRAVGTPQPQPTPTPQPKPQVDPALSQPYKTFAIPKVGNVDKKTYEAYKASQGFDTGTQQPITEEQKATIAQDTGSNIAKNQQEAQNAETIQSFIQNKNGDVQPTIPQGQGAGDIAATIGTSIPSLVGGASAGAGLGATVGSAFPVIGTAIGAVAGGIIGGVTAFLTQLAVDKRQATKEAYKTFNLMKGTRYTELKNMANAGYPASDVLHAYELNLANIREAQRELKAQTRGAVGKQLSGAMDELIAVDSYLEYEPYYRAELLKAVMNPNKANIIPITGQDLNTGDNLF